MQQVLFRIPWRTEWFPDGIPLYGFGLMLFLAFLLCTMLAGKRAEGQGIPRTVVSDLAIWLFVGGLIGARTFFLLVELGPDERPDSLVRFLVLMPQIWNGGIILYGGVLGALVSFLLAMVLVYRKQGLSAFQLADILAPSVALGICLGRIGCFLNGCCYGQVVCGDGAACPVHFPLSAPARVELVRDGYQTAAGFTLAPRQRDTGVIVGPVDPNSAAYRAGLRPGDVIDKVDGKDTSRADLAYYLDRGWPRGKNDLTLTVQGKGDLTFVPRTLGLYPTQIYESISMFLLFVFLSAFYPYRKFDGQVVALLMMGYGVHRFFNEMLRDDRRPIGFERYTSLILIVAGVLILVWPFLVGKRAARRLEPAQPSAA
jgi:prolipoprotein diacylglyceryltransferase